MISLFEQHVSRYPHYELTSDSSNYPEQLKNLDRTSPKLYVVGNIEILKQPLISIIGARKATPYGLACARMAGRIAAECGIVVVSGGAIGCDCEAQKAALDAGGKVIVVPGCGPDVLYPRSNDSLFYKALTTGGCVLSNIAWGQDPRAGTFISRNEVIAALGKSLIVCEAGIKSGTFTTASRASDFGRRIYAVPGSIFSPTSAGTNHLLEVGASIVSDAEALETLISLDYGRLRLVSQYEQPKRDALISALVASPMSVQDIASFTEEDIPSTFALIADLEAAGIIERQLDGKYSASLKELLRS